MLVFTVSTGRSRNLPRLLATKVKDTGNHRIITSTFSFPLHSNSKQHSEIGPTQKCRGLHELWVLLHLPSFLFLNGSTVYMQIRLMIKLTRLHVYKYFIIIVTITRPPPNLTSKWYAPHFSLQTFPPSRNPSSAE